MLVMADLSLAVAISSDYYIYLNGLVNFHPASLASCHTSLWHASVLCQLPKVKIYDVVTCVRRLCIDIPHGCSSVVPSRASELNKTEAAL